MISGSKRALLALTLLGAAPTPSWACATCGCTVNTDAAMGYSTASGWRANLEYTYIDQDELRSGTGSASAAQIVNNPSNPSLGGGEIEKDTINRYLTLGVSYRPNSSWNFNLLVPYVSRNHTTYGQQQQPYTPAETAPDQISGANVDSLGDVRLIASYQGLLPTHNLGLQLGVKLPTGSYGTTATFFDGPNKGAPLDASLQAGTGSTDLIAGAYFFQPVSQDFDAFATVQFQAAIEHRLDHPGEDYRPGNAATMSFGLRYEANPAWVPQLQVNVSRKSADQGALADRPDTAGTVAYLSPGVTVSLRQSLQGYAVLQVPVYSNLDGYQLFPHWTITMGLSHAF
jgi:Putative MetA-pathway of phenol degradation